MQIKLIFVLIFIMLMLLVYILRKIRAKRVSVKNAIVWVVADIASIVCIACVNPLMRVVQFFGIKTVSSLMFFLGFICLIVVCLNLSIQMSEQNKKIIALTQELALEKKEKEDASRSKKDS